AGDAARHFAEAAAYRLHEHEAVALVEQESAEEQVDLEQRRGEHLERAARRGRRQHVARARQPQHAGHGLSRLRIGLQQQDDLAGKRPTIHRDQGSSESSTIKASVLGAMAARGRLHRYSFKIRRPPRSTLFPYTTIVAPSF